MVTIIQKQFENFHEEIKLKFNDENLILRKKRDMILEELDTYFSKKSQTEEKAKITYDWENQGSYSMGTGIKPLEGNDYDIDIMLLFNISKDTYDPIEVKKWVFEALNKQFRTVEYKNACVRVQYHEQGEEAYHVDIACYANLNSDECTYLAKGRLTSASADKKWEVAAPKKLKEMINNKFPVVMEQDQFKRIIRFMKRWKDFKFKATKDGKPTGIALTALANKGFQPKLDREGFTNEKSPNDLTALIHFTNYFINEFDWNDEISVKLPVPPCNDLFEKMKKNKSQCKTLKGKLEDLQRALVEAQNEVDPIDACKIIQKQFGEDFKIPKAPETAQKRPKAIVGSTEQA